MKASARNCGIYCRYGMKAVEEGGEVDALAWNPTAGDWTMHVPCDAENIDWVRDALAGTSPRIKVFDVAEAERADERWQKRPRAKERHGRLTGTLKG